MQHLDSLPPNVFHTLHSEELNISGKDIEALAFPKIYFCWLGKNIYPKRRRSTQNVLHYCNITNFITVINIAMSY